MAFKIYQNIFANVIQSTLKRNCSCSHVKLLVDCGLLEHCIYYILILCSFCYELTVNADNGNIVQCFKEDIKSDLYVVDHPAYTKSGFYFQLEYSQAGKIPAVSFYLNLHVHWLDAFLAFICVHQHISWFIHSLSVKNNIWL